MLRKLNEKFHSYSREIIFILRIALTGAAVSSCLQIQFCFTSEIGLRRSRAVKTSFFQRTSESDLIIRGALSCAGSPAIFSFSTKSSAISAISFLHRCCRLKRSASFLIAVQISASHLSSWPRNIPMRASTALNQILVTLLCSNGMCVKSGEFYHLRRTRRLPSQAGLSDNRCAGLGQFNRNKQDRTVAVKAWTIDEICQENELTHIDLLKVDIEGAEKELFANGQFLETCELRHRRTS